MGQICRICSNKIENPIFSGEIFDFNINYFDCCICGFVQTEQPYWLDKAYSNAINNCDTGIMARNQSNVGLVLATLLMLGRINGTVIDCAGGYGILVRLLRDRGLEALWSDPYCQNLLAIGFEHTKESGDLVTAFEAFEHFVNPLHEVKKFFSIAPNLLISTELISTIAPSLNDWWYYGLDHGQHIGFYRINTLKYIARKFDKHLVTNGSNFHLFTDKPINAKQWKLCVLLARKLPFIFRHKLQSKTWSDFQRMSGRI